MRQMWDCPKCHSLNQPNSARCYHCQTLRGAAVAADGTVVAGGAGSGNPRTRVGPIGILAILLVLAVVVGVGLTAALGHIGPAASPSAPSMAATSPSQTAMAPPTASPSDPAVAPSPTPTPRATAVPIEQAAVVHFGALIAKKDLAYHMEVSGSSTAGTFRNRFRYSLDVVGGDFRGTLTTRDLAATCDGVRKAGRIYARCPGTAWASRDDSGGNWSFWPFMGLADIGNLNPPTLIKANGTTLVHVTSTGTYSTGINRMLNFANAQDTGLPVSLELWITTSGIPVKAVFRLGAIQTGQGTMTGKGTYVFTHVGRKVTIRAPK